MRAYVPGYELRAPRDLGETLDLLAGDPDAWKPMAGGTDLMVLFNAGALSHRKLLSLHHHSELKGVIVTADAVDLGATTTFTEILTDTTLRQEFPVLCEAAGLTGGLSIQNRGTLGGNLVNASPAADSPPALMIYEAELELVSAKGARWISCEAFYKGYRRVALDPGELLRRIRLPRLRKDRIAFYRKVAASNARAISKVSFAGLAEFDGKGIRDVRIAVGSVAPTAIRCQKTEAFLKDDTGAIDDFKGAQDLLLNEVSCIDDLRSTARYRRQVLGNLLELFLRNVRSKHASA